jgi:hypothetical protein
LVLEGNIACFPRNASGVAFAFCWQARYNAVKTPPKAVGCLIDLLHCHPTTGKFFDNLELSNFNHLKWLFFAALWVALNRTSVELNRLRKSAGEQRGCRSQ